MWILRWIWQCLSDLSTALDVLDWTGWKSWVLAAILATVSGGMAFLLNAPIWAVFAMAVAGACIALGGIIAWQNWRSAGTNRDRAVPALTAEAIQGLTRELERQRWSNATGKFTEQRRNRIVRELPSPLKIEYQEGLGSYFQEYPTRRAGLGDGAGQLVRIKVSHESPASIDNVQVKVQNVVPLRSIKGIPFHLHRMNDNPPAGSPVPFQAFTNLAHKQEEYFDVATHSKFLMSTGILEFNCIDGKAREIEEYPAEILIRVTGKDVKMVERRFRIDVDDQNNLKMSMLSES